MSSKVPKTEEKYLCKREAYNHACMNLMIIDNFLNARMNHNRRMRNLNREVPRKIYA